MQKIFSNLDKFYLKMIDKSLFYIAFQLFAEHAFLKQSPRIVALIIDILNKERSGDIIPSDQIIKGIRCIFELGCQKDVQVKKVGKDIGGTQYIFESKIEPKYYIDEFEKKLINDVINIFYKKLILNNFLIDKKFLL